MKKQGNSSEVAGARAVERGECESGAATVSKTKRMLLKAGWVAPVIAVVSLPASGNPGHLSCDPKIC